MQAGPSARSAGKLRPRNLARLFDEVAGGHQPPLISEAHAARVLLQMAAGTQVLFPSNPDSALPNPSALAE